MLSVNEYQLSFTGKACISSELKRSVDYKFTITAAIPKAVITDTEDGKIDILYKAKIVSVQTVSEGKPIKMVASKHWSQSKKIRFAVENYRQEQGIELDEETFYTAFTNAILNNLPEIMAKYLKV